MDVFFDANNQLFPNTPGHIGVVPGVLLQSKSPLKEKLSFLASVGKMGYGFSLVSCFHSFLEWESPEGRMSPLKLREHVW
jgi:hypothetical protein